MSLFELLTTDGGDPREILAKHRKELFRLDPSDRLAVALRVATHKWDKEWGEDEAGSAALGAWFLGPKGENAELFRELVDRAIKEHAKDRVSDYPRDPKWVTDKRKKTRAYQKAVELLEERFNKLIERLGASVPFFSYRYQGHMLWDTTLPAMLGYFAAMLYNQNNVAAEASPVTTWLEMKVGKDLCRMLGYDAPGAKGDGKGGDGEAGAWGHITCDGSIANMEALWAARNLKYYPLGIAAALTHEAALARALGLDVKLPTGETRVLSELEPWQLLNLQADAVLALPRRIKEEYGIPSDTVDAILEKYTLQQLGFLEFRSRFAATQSNPVALAPATMHYSWPKGAALMGLGRGAMRSIAVDLDGRMDVRELRRTLDACLRDRVPVLMVIAVLGTTAESAVDPLAAILDARESFRAKGLEFWLHVDAAWGGYFASMLRKPTGEARELTTKPVRNKDDAGTIFFEPSIAMNEYVNAQYERLGEADSITVDPHKAGYIPYPAGGLCYRNSAMRHLVAFTSPVVYKGETDPTVGVYGIEGSKPGAAAAATYLSHRVIRPDQSGYGRILGRCMWNSKRFYAELVTMAGKSDPFRIVPFQRLPVQRRKTDCTDAEVEKDLKFIRETIVGKSDDDLIDYIDKKQLRTWFRNLGSDQIIVTYAFNFEKNGVLNTDVGLLNQLNSAIFSRLSMLTYEPSKNGKAGKGKKKTSRNDPVPLFVTSTRMDPATYGAATVDSFKKRLGIVDGTGTPVDVLITTTMDPWLTDTEDGNFIPKLIEELRQVVLEEVDKLVKETFAGGGKKE